MAEVLPPIQGLFYADRNTTAPDWRWDSALNRWDGWLLWYIGAGEGTIEYPGAAGGRYQVVAGDCFVFAMSERHFGSAERPLDVHAVGFRTAVSGPLWPQQRRHRKVRRARLLQDLIDSCVQARQGGDEQGAVHWLRSALMIIAEEDARPRPVGRDLEHAKRVDDLADRMRVDPAAAWSSDLLRRELGVGREHAIRLFKRHRGVAPGEWLIACRLDRAKHLLRFSSASVREVAAQVGYRDPYYFSRIFHRHCACSPSAYRRAPWYEDEGNARTALH